jgi:putative nucleotidyltransferase with HDIG domain
MDAINTTAQDAQNRAALTGSTVSSVSDASEPGTDGGEETAAHTGSGVETRTDARMRILVVDDEKRILQTVSLMLSELGHSLKTAENAEEALHGVSQDRFDIAFLDYYIGKDRGLDLMQKLAATAPELYFVIITANGSTDLAVEALKRGAADFIVKPFFAADLIKSIDFVSKRRELDRQKKEMLLTLEAKVQERTRDLESIHIDVLSSLAQALETRDFSTYGHCKRVSNYSRLIADELRLDSADMHYLEIGSLLHDVGKIGITDYILLKPGKLNGEEWDSLKCHPAKGVEILKPLKYLEPALPTILHHHEYYDGTGYPGGLKGEEIPLSARIIAVADAWDVMRSDRPYRKALSREAARAELLKFAGTQFDPNIVNIFIRLT